MRRSSALVLLASCSVALMACVQNGDAPTRTTSNRGASAATAASPSGGDWDNVPDDSPTRPDGALASVLVEDIIGRWEVDLRRSIDEGVVPPAHEQSVSASVFQLTLYDRDPVGWGRYSFSFESAPGFPPQVEAGEWRVVAEDAESGRIALEMQGEQTVYGTVIDTDKRMTLFVRDDDTLLVESHQVAGLRLVLTRRNEATVGTAADAEVAVVDEVALRELQGAAPGSITGRWEFSAEDTLARTPDAAIDAEASLVLTLDPLGDDRVGRVELGGGDGARPIEGRWRISDSDLGRGALTITIDGARGDAADRLLDAGDVTLDIDAAGRLVAIPGPPAAEGSERGTPLVFRPRGPTADVVGRWVLDMQRTRVEFDIRYQEFLRDTWSMILEFERLDAVGTGAYTVTYIDPAEDDQTTEEGTWSVRELDLDGGTMIIFMDGHERTTGQNTRFTVETTATMAWDDDGTLVMRDADVPDSPMYFVRP